jgi:hypothetical protein
MVTHVLRLACLALLVLTAACGTDSSPAQTTEERPAMKDRPAMETMVKRYEAMQADVFDSLEKEFGAKPWEVSPNSLGGGRSGCSEGDPDGEKVYLPSMSFTGTYPADDWQRVRDLVEETGREHGFDDVAHVKDEPGDLDMVGEDKYGAQYEFGMAKNTVFGLRTGCHRWNEKPPPGALRP